MTKGYIVVSTCRSFAHSIYTIPCFRVKEVDDEDNQSKQILVNDCKGKMIYYNE